MPILLRALFLSEIEIKESNLFFLCVCVSMCIYVFIYVYWCVSVFFFPSFLRISDTQEPPYECSKKKRNASWFTRSLIAHLDTLFVYIYIYICVFTLLTLTSSFVFFNVPMYRG